MTFLDRQKEGSGPFFMMLSTPACHAPFTPAPQYSSNFSDKQAPRDGSYNVHAKVSYIDVCVGQGQLCHPPSLPPHSTPVTSLTSRHPETEVIMYMPRSVITCHAPFTPAPQYSSNFSDKQAPRDGSYNVHAKVSYNMPRPLHSSPTVLQ